MILRHEKSVLIVGAGISGLTAGRLLVRAGWRVCLLDKGRGVGGRMANRRFDGAQLDHGAQYFTARDSRFRRDLEHWISIGCARLWYDADPDCPTSDPRYLGYPAMTAIPKYLASELEISLGHRVEGAWFDGTEWTVRCEGRARFQTRWLLLTPPLPQALSLLEGANSVLPPPDAKALRRIRYEKCVAALVTLSGPSGLSHPGIIRPKPSEPLALVADNAVKGISDVPAVTLHSGPRFAETCFDDADEAKADALLAAARPYLRADPRSVQVHRWAYAKPLSYWPVKYYFNQDTRLLIAGDAFGGGRVEGAALSGQSAAEALIQNHENS